MAAVAEKAIGSDEQLLHRKSPPSAAKAAEESDRDYKRNVKRLVDLLSKLNPFAKEFVPSSHADVAGEGRHCKSNSQLSADAPVFVASSDYYYNYGLISNTGSRKDSSGDGSSNNQPNRRRRNGFSQGKKRPNYRHRGAKRDDSIKRTVYVSDIDHLVTEQKLAGIFSTFGPVVDCRICGDPNSTLRFAFIEFTYEGKFNYYALPSWAFMCHAPNALKFHFSLIDGARAALNLGGAMLGYFVRVLPSKTAILPVNPKFLPISDVEKEMVVRTVYCTNIDKKVTEADVKSFFERLCGEVSRLRLLGDSVHSTCIAFVEFVQAESAIVALNCSGMLLGALPVRVSPSKTPVRPHAMQATSN
ncbi:polyadenylate-binding protein-interacting protein 9-like isoform X1 [Zingiber officinale]|uniref:polyadenylate-binding protein-interacting protein 9-like isoform X1 n=1 Tax=Zingiber officinale TaxID=94328 RepID=UPI001C4B22D5|nr:polyadenylate-binding protein-interacting protein 9-like isoform X1 [Zingiber officinale]